MLSDDSEVWVGVAASDDPHEEFRLGPRDDAETLVEQEAQPAYRGKTGPSAPKPTVLSAEDEAVIVAFRRHMLLPLDDCLYALQPTLPHLTRSSLRRCLQRHGISRLPETDGDKPLRAKFKR